MAAPSPAMTIGGTKERGRNVVKHHAISLIGSVTLGLALFTAGAAANAAGVLMLTSPAYKDNAVLAVKSACSNKQRSPNCVGQNISPPFAFHNPPAGTKSYALLMHDPEGRAPAGVEHMVIYGIPVAVTGFAEGELSKPSEKFVGGKSTMGVGIYTGPGTPPGTDWHHYTLTLIATDLDPKALPPGLTRDELTKALAGHVKGSAGLILRFRHSR
jgi:Raf kinase inhibitor-like YbhB/YbcL family protein